MQPRIVIPKEYEGKITRTARATPKIIILHAETPEPLAYIAGQYASFLIDEHRRPLSYASPAGTTELQFIVDISPGGVASTFVADLAVGDSFRFLSPYGRFVVEDSFAGPLLFIATGSGIAPIRAQILHQLAHAPARPMILLFGNKNEQHMFLYEEFTELAQAHAQFTFIPVCSEPSYAWTGARGLVTRVVLERVSNLLQHDVYVCGNPHMAKDVTRVLTQAGLPRERIHAEQFS